MNAAGARFITARVVCSPKLVSAQNTSDYLVLPPYNCCLSEAVEIPVLIHQTSLKALADAS